MDETLYVPTLCPLFEDSYYSYTINLADESYTLTFRWNERLEKWNMSIEDAEQTAILDSCILTVLTDIIGQYSLKDIPGVFILTPIESNLQRRPVPNERKLYETHRLYHITTV